jgi:hypothetical protein
VIRGSRATFIFSRAVTRCGIERKNFLSGVPPHRRAQLAPCPIAWLIRRIFKHADRTPLSNATRGYLLGRDLPVDPEPIWTE